MARRRRAHAQDNTPTPKVTIPHSAFPYLIDLIFDAADRSTLLAFRATSRDFQDRADAVLLRHISIKGPQEIPTIGRDRRRHEFYDGNGLKAPIRPLEATVSRGDFTSFGDRIERWCRRETGLKHVQIVDIPHTFHFLYAFDLPALKYVRVHHTDNHLDDDKEKAFEISFLPLTTQTLVTFGRYLPRNAPNTRSNAITFPYVEPVPPQTVVVNLLAGSMSDPTSLNVNFYSAAWKDVTNLVFILSPDFFRMTTCTAYRIMMPWLMLSNQLRRLLTIVRSTPGSCHSVTLVGAAEALFNTVQDHESLPGEHPVTSLHVGNLLDSNFWEAEDERDDVELYISSLLGVERIIEVIKEYNVKVLSLEEYKATRTADEFEFETELPSSADVA
ncbi:uncharacterized protein LOC62_03G003901 [Vanrija pseudolonga]|uniref:Uncharacterized protein n=1 Tax=Vanrija pseudolonga TaxID=143232 RepID=A0AAF1BHJ9_9TREE|nr:hypothetical protein LOC62_03G003901 [Vanrija pseudolonga]